MELTSQVLKKNKHNLHCEEVENFKKLNLSTKASELSMDKFIALINEKKYKKYTKSLIRQFVKNTDDNICYAILFSYVIVSFNDELFGDFQTNFESNLLDNANNLTTALDTLNEYLPVKGSKIFYHNESLFSIIDKYYSKYQKWDFKKSFNEMDKIYNLLEEELIILNRNKSHTKYHIDNVQIFSITDKIDRLISLNKYYSIELILHNILHLLTNKYIYDYLWNKIDNIYKVDGETIILILIIEAKIKIIKLLNKPCDIKDLYYNIDIGNIMDQIKNSNFKRNDVNDILQILENKLIIGNQNYKCFGNYDNHILVMKHIYTTLKLYSKKNI